MKQPFETAELKAELERSLGFALRSFERLDGASAFNFKAVREADGFTFAVKCSPLAKQDLFDRYVRHITELKGTKTVERLFERECPPTFGGCNVVCTSWCAGERVFPDKLTDGQFVAFLDDFREFSAALQKTTLILPEWPILEWRETALGKDKGLGGKILRKLILEMPLEDLCHRPELLKVIHSDFHYGNFLFADGRVAGYMDLEEFCLGYPPDDLLRYFCCAAEHLRWYEQRRKRRMLALFALAVRHMSYSRHEWRTAINARYMNRVFMNTHERKRIGLGTALNLAFRAMFYRKLRRIVAEEPGEGDLRAANGLYLFVLWRKARPHRERILADLERRFTVLERFDIRWPWWRTPFLLRAFYSDRRLVRWFRKAVTCGAWSFEAVLVRDERPEYAVAARDAGYCDGENMHVHDVKHRYREWTGGRWRVHSSFSPRETARQYQFLTGHGLSDHVNLI